MKNSKYFVPVMITLLSVALNVSHAQCANPTNIYSFNYNNKTYQVVKENRNWADAAACAASLGGILAEINDVNEQNAIFTELNSNAGINPNLTRAPDGGNGSYVWLGGNDIATEGNWIWNGDNDSSSTPFWSGNANGSPVGGLYNNWGDNSSGQTEPDNFNSNQDSLGISLNGWPLGAASEWNDVRSTNTLYYIIEYNSILSVDTFKQFDIQLSPNPVTQLVKLESEQADSLEKIIIYNVLGQPVKEIKKETNNSLTEIDMTALTAGIYILKIYNDTNSFIIRRIIKK